MPSSIRNIACISKAEFWALENAFEILASINHLLSTVLSKTSQVEDTHPCFWIIYVSAY